MLIEPIRATTRYGDSGKTSTLRYTIGSALVIVVLFGLFLLAGLEI
ncbi:hypothetical protein [Belnapia rosea]|uniref:Uncharacterized protein n=1 Tax=Belnapia rosea TaxID=938405 RepID=A0A1G6UWF3_9PROT|nr:hypothetical protein [Belnapia rosea]SDB72435.1 hypothetical protein SAMN02927895_04427 [Belnapia rosea]SDD45690.1 hypothetical protein SAMN04487779_100847 [Belnapia rosea]